MTMTEMRRGEAAAGTGLWPQVDLLPPEVRAARRLKAIQRVLAIVLLGVVLAAVAGWALAQLALLGAKTELTKAQDDTTRLVAEQQKYADVPKIKGALTAAQQALVDTTQTEVVWRKYVGAIQAVTPSQFSYDSLIVSMQDDPSANVSTDPLAAPSIGQITITGRATTLLDASAWMDAMDSVPGLSDAWITQTAVTDEDGFVYFAVSGTVQVNDIALAHRFVTDDEQGDDSTATDDSTGTDDTQDGN